MLPQTENLPATAAQLFRHKTITHTILLKFIDPILTITLGVPAMLRTAMPKTPINKNSQPLTAEEKIRQTRQLLIAQPAPDARLAKNSSKPQLCIFVPIGTDCSHHLRALFPIEYISHGNSTDFSVFYSEEVLPGYSLLNTESTSSSPRGTQAVTLLFLTPQVSALN